MWGRGWEEGNFGCIWEVNREYGRGEGGRGRGSVVEQRMRIQKGGGAGVAGMSWSESKETDINGLEWVGCVW